MVTQAEREIPRGPGDPLEERQRGGIRAVDIIDHEETRAECGQLVEAGQQQAQRICRHRVGKLEPEQPLRHAIGLLQPTEVGGGLVGGNPDVGHEPPHQPGLAGTRGGGEHDG